MEELNYAPKMVTIHKIIKRYSLITHTLAGRITVVKMFILPTLVHILQVLPSPQERYTKQIKDCVKNFIWNNKRPKIRHNLLIQDYENGGLKMLDLDSFFMATKLTWIVRLQQTNAQNTWVKMLCQCLGTKYPLLLFQGSRKFLINHKNKLSNDFWKEVFNNWIKYRKSVSTLSEMEELPNIVIWNSDLLTNENLRNKQNYFIEKGLIFFKDLYNYQDGVFYDRDDIWTMFKIKMNFLEFLSILNPLSKSHKEVIIKGQTTSNDRTKNLLSGIYKQEKVCSHIYKQILNTYTEKAQCKHKWVETLNKEITELDWKRIFTLINSITQDVQLRMFQFKIVHRILPTNSSLFMYNIRENPYCDDCPNTIETSVHLFKTCPKVSNLWNDLASYLYPQVDLFPYVNTENIMLGIYEHTKCLQNTIILLVKRYIFICKSNKSNLNMKALLIFLNSHEQIEINSSNPQRKQYNVTKWATIDPLLTSKTE